MTHISACLTDSFVFHKHIQTLPGKASGLQPKGARDDFNLLTAFLASNSSQNERPCFTRGDWNK